MNAKLVLFAGSGFAEGSHPVRMQVHHHAGFEFACVITRLIEYSFCFSQRPPVAEAKKDRRHGLQLPDHLLESVGTMPVQYEHLGDACPFDGCDKVRKEQGLGGRIHVECQWKIVLLGVHTEGNARQHDNAGTPGRGLLGGFPGNTLGLPRVSSVWEVRIVCLGGSPGEDDRFHITIADIGPGEMGKSGFHGCRV